MDDDFRITVGLENRTHRFQAMPNVLRIYQVAVMRDSHHSFIRLHKNGLRVEQRGIAGGRITCVSDGQRAVQGCEHLFGEDVGDESHRFMSVQTHPVGGDDSR